MATPFPALDGSAPRKQQFESSPELGIDPSKRYTATIETSMGTIVVALDAVNAPKTVNNFVFLAAQHYYDGVVFHRIINGFMCQGGDPTGTGRGGAPRGPGAGGGGAKSWRTSRSSSATRSAPSQWPTRGRTRTAVSSS